MMSIIFPMQSAIAQDVSTCEQIVEAALQSTDERCQEIGDNQACYGHSLVEAIPWSVATPLRFATPGDKADLIQLQTVRVSELDMTNGYWGIALMRLLVQVPEADLSEASLLVFGSVDVTYATNTSDGGIWVEARLPDVNIYESPSSDSTSVQQVWFGQFLRAIGRLADDSWLQVEVPGTSFLGWVNADSVKSIEDSSSLPVVDTLQPQIGPLQVFQLETGLDEGSPCDNAPPNGLLVQTPEGIAEVTFLVNEVNIQMRATAFLQAERGREMIVSVLNGQARVTAQGITQVVRAGESTTIPLNQNLAPSWPPSPPVSDQSVVQNTQSLAALIAVEPANTVTSPAPAGISQPIQVDVPSAPVQPVAPAPTVEVPPPPLPPPPSQNDGGGSSSGGDGNAGGDSGSGAPGGGGSVPGGGSGAPGS